MLSTQSDRELLRHFHADQIEHSGGSLLAHLAGTAALLESWGAPTALCRAGHFHSIYGTEALTEVAASLDASTRDLVRAQLGAEAERLVYLFGTLTRDSLYRTASALLAGRTAATATDRRDHAQVSLDAETCAALLQLAAANWLEQLPRLSPALGRSRAAEVRHMLPLMPAPARRQLAAAIARCSDADPTADPVPLHALLAFDDLALVEQSSGALDVRYLSAMSAQLLARAPRPLRARLEALSDAAYVALLRAPATCTQLRGGAEDPAALADHLEGALQLEEWRAGGRQCLDRDGWSADGEVYLPAGLRVSPAELFAERASEPRSFDPARPYLAPTLGGWAIADLHSPLATCALEQQAYKRVPYGPAEPFSAAERQTVLDKLAVAFAGIADVAPVATRFLRATLVTVIPRKQTQPHLYPNSFKGSSNEAAIHRINLYNPQFDNVDAARLAQSVLHETVHNHLYKRELFQPTVIDERAAADARVTSPWSGNTLDAYVFAHSATVYYALHRFFSRALERHAEGRAAAGFPAATCAWFRDRAVKGFGAPAFLSILEEHRELIAPAMARDLRAMRDTVMASDASLAVEAA